MKTIYCVQSIKGIRLDISSQRDTSSDLNDLLLARDLCYTAIETINEIINTNYPLEK